MGTVRFTRLAEADLLDIGLYTHRTWGRRQCSLRELEELCRQLASDPTRGRSCDEIRPGLRRIRVGKHIVFYRGEPGGILVSRILHERTLPEDQAMERRGRKLGLSAPKMRKIFLTLGRTSPE